MGSKVKELRVRVPFSLLLLVVVLRQDGAAVEAAQTDLRPVVVLVVEEMTSVGRLDAANHRREDLPDESLGRRIRCKNGKVGVDENNITITKYNNNLMITSVCLKLKESFW